MRFQQSTGKFTNGTQLLAYGYAGREKGKNNPSMENVKGIGPLPAGRYFPRELFQVHPTVGKFAIRLEPDEETRKKIVSYGRDPISFFCHGDSSEHPGLASHGCIVVLKPLREKIWAAQEWIEVVA